MPHDALSPARTVAFDAYGTLFDLDAAVDAYRERLGELTEPFSALWRWKQVEYSWLRTLTRQYVDFWHVLRDALDYALDAYGLTNDDLKRGLLDAYLQAGAYDEAVPVFERLRADGRAVAVLSNGTAAMLDVALRSAGVHHLVDHVCSVDAVQAYKPDPRTYRMLNDHVDGAAHGVVFVSAFDWDVAGAVAAGLPGIWLNRFGARGEHLPSRPHLEVRSMLEVPGVLGL